MGDALPPGRWIARGPIRTFRHDNLEAARHRQQTTIARILTAGRARRHQLATIATILLGRRAA